MKAVNLIPSEGRRPSGIQAGLPQGPAYIVVGALALVLAFVTIYVLSTNTISDRKAQLVSLQSQAAQVQAQAAHLANYSQFATLANQRTQTVREIAATRFDWHSALADLSRVVPANTSLESVYGSVAPGATIQGASGGASGSGVASTLRADLSVPAFELTGCSKTQDDVARLMSRLRVIDGVTRVTLGDSQKPATTQSGTSSTAAAGSGTAGASSGCGANEPVFDIVVFFEPLAGAGPTGVTSPTSGSTSSSGGAK